MRHMVNGQIGEWRTEADGSVRFHPIREFSGVQPKRPVILHFPDGRNCVVNLPYMQPLSQDQLFVDIPLRKRRPITPEESQALIDAAAQSVRTDGTDTRTPSEQEE